MASQPDKNEVVRVDFAFKRELGKKVEGDLANFCYQCGAHASATVRRVPTRTAPSTLARSC